MTPRYKLRTLLILLAVLPPLLWLGWGRYEAWRTEKLRREEEWRALRVLAVAGIVAASLILGVVVSGWQAWRASEAASLATSHAEAEKIARHAEANERLRAEANFEKAWQAVDQMLTRAASQTLKDIPQMGPVRAELLEDAVKFYEGFLQGQGTNRAIRDRQGLLQSRQYPKPIRPAQRVGASMV